MGLCGWLILQRLGVDMKTDLERFTDGYMEALYFTDCGDERQPPSDAEMDVESQKDLEADCRSWWRRFGCFVTTEVCTDAFDDVVKQAGIDFHMTRNGHGVGFWEDEWPECYRYMFTNGAKAYGEVDIYLGDDGLIYC